MELKFSKDSNINRMLAKQLYFTELKMLYAFSNNRKLVRKINSNRL